MGKTKSGRIGVNIPMSELSKKVENIMDDIYDQTTIIKDVSKIEFDFENVEYTNDNGFADLPCGEITLPNGHNIIGVTAGGDWEHPVFFCIYWDGKKLRAYVPTDGNTFNKKYKSAYGNNDEGENEAPACNQELLFADIMNRIKI